MSKAPPAPLSIAQHGNPKTGQSAENCAAGENSAETTPLGLVRVGWTTLPSRKEAEHLAHAAVEGHLASCAQVDGPITSYYPWKGELHRDEEWRVTLKFPASHAAALETWLLANHPYETPQWLAVNASQVSPAYHQWLLSRGVEQI